MLDQERWIGAQAIMKEVLNSTPIEPLNGHYDFHTWEEVASRKFSICIKIMETYATLSPDDEWVNCEIPITKEFWNQSPQIQTQWLSEWGKPLPVVNKVGRKEWYIHSKRKDVDKVKKVFSDRENEFQDMVNVQAKKETK